MIPVDPRIEPLLAQMAKIRRFLPVRRRASGKQSPSHPICRTC